MVIVFRWLYFTKHLAVAVSRCLYWSVSQPQSQDSEDQQTNVALNIQ